MKERPILFSGPMVKAILDGRKTQTRRIIKIQPKAGQLPLLDVALDMRGNEVGVAVWWITEADLTHSDDILCPHGKPGDRLWVKETWRVDAIHNGMPPRDLPQATQIEYVAGRQEVRWPAAMGKLRPSIFMPRWASRITLEITGVRVERLQDISEEDAAAEGVDCIQARVPTCRDAYRYLWEDINGAGSWAADPWVWVIEFCRVEAA